MAVQFNYLDFANGSGIRFLGREAREQSPVTNDRVNYYFQDFTGDDSDYVSFVFPVFTPDLPDKLDNMPPEIRQQAEADYNSYFAQSTEDLAQLDPGTDWLPSISMLDGMVQLFSICLCRSQPDGGADGTGGAGSDANRPAARHGRPDGWVWAARPGLGTFCLTGVPLA
jgi:hypothetical protein